MANYSTTLGELSTEFERDTDSCPICESTVREMRNGDKWLCDGCARYWEESEL